jgi:hypothetical protein
MDWEKIKCYLCENDEAIMKPDLLSGDLDILIRCPTCKFYLLTFGTKRHYFDSGLLIKQDKEELSLRVQKDYNPEKENQPVQITRELIKEETGKKSVHEKK